MTEAGKITGRGGTSVWVTVAAELVVHDLAGRQPKLAGRGADRRIASAQRLLFTEYCDYVEAVPVEEEEPCFVGTLFAYPGAAHSGSQVRNKSSRYDRPGRTSRAHETTKSGSKRMFLSPQVRELAERAVPHGLVLEGQSVATRPAGSAVHPLDGPAKAQGGRRGRPLTDVVMTAVARRQRLTDGPLANIEHQVLTKKLARALWGCASRGVDERGPQRRRQLIQGSLADQLPRLLSGGSARFELLTEAAPSWTGTLTALAEHLDEVVARSPQGLQLALFDDVGPS